MMKSLLVNIKSFFYYTLIFGILFTIPKIMGQDFLNDLEQEFSQSDSVNLALIGDIIIHDSQLASAWDGKLKQYNFHPVFSEIEKYLSSADLTIGNLETTLPGKKDLYRGYPRFGAPDALATALKDAGIDIITTANNHACDTGYIGVVHTIEALKSNNLLHLGTYCCEADYQKNRIMVLDKMGIKIALLNYTYALNGNPIPDGTRVNLLRKKIMAEDLQLARNLNPDVIMVLLHCGSEYQRLPDDYQISRADFLFHEGADMVIMSHPHVLQPFELKPITDKYGITRNRLVVYSLGNFLSNQRERYRDGGIIFYLTIQKNQNGLIKIKNIHYIPVWVYVYRTYSRKQFVILPVTDFLKNDQLIRLTKPSYQKMLTFYHDTVEHLKECMSLINK